jgi:hypothetical protein
MESFGWVQGRVAMDELRPWPRTESCTTRDSAQHLVLPSLALCPVSSLEEDEALVLESC